MIEYILQVHGVNCLQVHYKSGFNRWLYLGDRYYIMTKTQENFMNAAEVEETETATIWRKKTA